MDYLMWSQWKNEDILINGVKIWHKQVDVQTAVLCAIVDAGSRHDGVHPGIAHFTEHMLFQGTQKYSDEQIKLLAAQNGIRINASTSKEFLTVDLESILPDKIEIALNICQEVIISPAFSEMAFEKERLVVLNEIRDKEDRPLSKAMELASSLICEHPFKIPVLGTIQAIQAMTVKDMVSFHRSRFVPENVTVCYAGPMSLSEFVASCNSRFGGWKRSVVMSSVWETNRFMSYSAGNILHKDNQNQVAAVIAYPGSTIESDDKIKLKALCDIIGGGAMVSRMFRKLRNQQGLCYFCGAFSQEFYGANGLLALCGNVSPDKTEAFVDGALQIVEDLRSKEPITDQELQTSKTRFKAEMLETVDNLSSYMQWFLYLWVARGTRNIGKDLEAIDALTINDLTGTLNKYFSNNPIITLVGNIQQGGRDLTKMHLEDFQYQAPPTGGYAPYAGTSVDRPSPAGSHATNPNATKPAYAPSDRKVDNVDDVLKPQEEEDVPSSSDDTLQDAEPSCIPKAKSVCKSCGVEFEHLDGVAVYKCPDCKLNDIDATQPPKRVSIYSQEEKNGLKNAIAPGRDVVTHPIAGIPTKPLKLPPYNTEHKPNSKATAPKQKPATTPGYKEYSEQELNKQAEDQARAAEWARISRDMEEPGGANPTPAPKIPGVNTPTIGRGGAPVEATPVAPVHAPGEQTRDDHGRFAPKH